MFARKPQPCPVCDALRAQIASLEAQLQRSNERFDALVFRQMEKPEEPGTTLPEQEEEPLPSAIQNAIHRAANRAEGASRSELLVELDEQARLFLSEDVDEDEIVRRILTGDWDGEESANLSADEMR